MGEIHVHDGALPAAMLDRLRTALARLPYRYGWKSQVGQDWPPHFNAQILKADEKNTEDQSAVLDDFQEPWVVFRDCWHFVRDTWFKGAPALLRYYSNMNVYGVGGFPHTDSKREGETTALLYLCQEWKREWAGATAIFDAAGREIEIAVLPKPGRLLLFPSHRLHVGWEVSRVCQVARQILVVKVRQ